ncbi:hypothetical protein M8Z33_19445 [Streptomyces sp. ZAF1911]|uniref:hypothetical protein n=1 Tax=Streptomyces sp. ZAF1911 TaxID=2944129 RepID=UPI00237C5275|nr:hypothetical protein [Streptomyces sp. ZAF1911]MDD9378793.1 hypothetical protein [Streptomyces sp. ZAF1911]
MNTFLDYLLVLAVAALLAGPAVYGALQERHIDRQLRTAQQQTRTTRTRTRTRPERTRSRAPRVAVRQAPGR